MYAQQSFDRLFLELNHNELNREIETPLNFGHIKRIFKIAENAGCIHFTLAGADPVAHPDFLDIVTSSPDPVCIQIKKTMIEEREIAIIMSLKKNVELRFTINSFESSEKETIGDYERTRKRIIAARQAGFVVSVHTILSPTNASELLRLYNVMKNLRVDLWMVDFVFNSGEEHPCFLPNSYLQFQSALFESATKIALQHFREQPSFDLVIPDFYDSIAIALNIKRDFSVDSKVFANERTLTVRHNAMVSFSPHLPHTFGNIFSETISSITSRSAWQRLQNLRVKNLSPQCLQCKLMKQCGGGNRAAAWIATNKINLAHRFNCSLQKFQSMHLEPVLKGTVRGSLTQALS